jgi:two-component system chemotaxis response regulator CheB
MIPASVVVVQEISPKILKAFAKQFDERVPWKVEAAEDNMVLEQGTCYISPYDKLLSLQTNNNNDVYLKYITGNDSPLDLLFSSAAQAFHQNTIGVLLTGIGADGTDGFSNIRKVSGITMAQEAQTCVYPNLTDNAIKSGVVDIVLDENKLSKAIETVIK